MSYFEQLLESKYHYFQKYRELTELDLNIIYTMISSGPDGPRNVSRIAKELGLPQQTANYRVNRFDEKDLVRFCAIIDESMLGLASYAILSTTKTGHLYENKRGTAVNAGTFLTCYPAWRLLEEIRGGDLHGFFVQYSIPPQKENDLKSFLIDLREIGCILRLDNFLRVTQSCFNKPSFVVRRAIRKAVNQGRAMSFNWERWAMEFDKAQEGHLPKETVPKKGPLFSYEDLLVLYCLEKNLREKFVDIAKSVGESSSKIAKRYKDILRHGLINDCRAQLYIIDPARSIHLILEIVFTNEAALRKLISHLNDIPYPVTYQKIVGKHAILLHVMLPVNEYFDFLNTFEIWGRDQGIINDFKLYLSSYGAQFYNLGLYLAFSREENRWAFSKEVIDRALHRLITDTRYHFDFG